MHFIEDKIKTWRQKGKFIYPFYLRQYLIAFKHMKFSMETDKNLLIHLAGNIGYKLKITSTVATQV
jgi:hypothetical protein